MFSTFSGSFSYGRKLPSADLPILLNSNVTLTGATVVSNTVTQFGASVNCYSLAGSTSSHVNFVPGARLAFGTGDYTIEWFQYETDANAYPRVFWYGTSPTYGVSIENGTFYTWTPSFVALKSGLSQKNAWRHFALVRISSKIYLYYDGAIQNAGGFNSTTNFTDSTSRFYIGSKAGAGLASEQYGGLITNFRICKGLGVYTGNFTVPSSPLEATQSSGTNISAITNQCVVLLKP